MEIFFEILGFFLIWGAVYYKRNEYTRIELLSWDWVLVTALVIAGVLIIKHAGI